MHGLFGALSNWVDVVGHFSQRYRVIIPLMPIYTLPVLNTNVKALAEFVHDFLVHKQLKDVILMGNSLGGHVTLVFVKRHAELVKAMVLTGSYGLYENAMGGSFPKREDYNFIKAKVESMTSAPGTGLSTAIRSSLPRPESPCTSLKRPESPFLRQRRIDVLRVRWNEWINRHADDVRQG